MVADLIAQYPPAGSAGTIIYVDTTAAVDGTGSFASPRNVFPSFPAYQNNTVLFAEGTTFTGQISAGAVGGYDYGTYSRLDGSRVFDKARLATIQASAFITAINHSGAGANRLHVGGLRITGATNAAGIATGVYLGNNTAGSTLILEHCVIDNISGTNIPSSLAASLRCETVIVRFCEINITNGDAIWCQATTGNSVVEMYGNRILVGSNTNGDGPDSIQFFRNTGGIFRNVNIVGNWIEHNAMPKQGIIVSGNNPTAGTERWVVRNNFIFGVTNPEARTDLSGNLSAPAAFQFEAHGVSLLNNWIDGWRIWGVFYSTTTVQAVCSGNVFITDKAAYANTVSPMVGTRSSGDDGAIFANNTLIATKPLPDMVSDQACARFSGTNNVIRNNVFLGGWRHAFRFHGGSGQTEQKNVFWGITDRLIVGTAAGSSLAIDASSAVADPLLDEMATPSIASPLVAAADSVTLPNSSRLIVTDIFGAAADDINRQTVGAIQVTTA
jgi:hypothetical protein